MSNKLRGIPGLGRTAPSTINVGHGNFIVGHRIIAILECGSLPMKRLREKAAETNHLVDATAGRKTRSLVVTDSNHVILSALAPQTLQDRVHEDGGLWTDPGRVEWEEGEFVS
jgi:extracellular matrix regulatory protein A